MFNKDGKAGSDGSVLQFRGMAGELGGPTNIFDRISSRYRKAHSEDRLLQYVEKN